MKDQQKLDMEGVQQLVTELLELNWFEKCGIKEEIQNIDIEYVKDKKTFEKKVSGLNWENKLLSKAGDMSEYIGNLDEKYLDESNEKVEYYRENYIPPLENVLQNRLKKFELTEIVLPITRYIIMIMLKAKHFSKLYTDTFWDQILEIYKSGHIPCGYKKGVFLVY